MQKYDKIYVPISTASMEPPDKRLTNGQPLLETPNVIVLTVEELKELYDTAYDNGYADNGMDLSDYIQSKGITL